MDYCTDEQKAIRYLEKIQEDSLLERFGVDFAEEYKQLFKNKENTDFLEEFIKTQKTATAEEIEELKNEVIKSFQSVVILTRYEVPHSAILLNTLFAKIDETAKRINCKIAKRPIIGTAFSKSFNAFAVRVPDTKENVIVFESELFTLCNLLAKIIASCLPDFKIGEKVSFSYTKDRIENHLRTNPIISQRFADFVDNAILEGQPNKTKQYFLSDIVGKLHYELLNSLELFIVGHEYGHIFAGHLDKAILVKTMIGDEEFSKIKPDWQMEYEADFHGVNLLVNSDNSRNFLPFSILGPELFFTFIDITERANALIYQGKEVRSSGDDEHPATYDRRISIRDMLNRGLPKDELKAYQVGGQFLENVLEILWRNYKKSKGLFTSN